jgi:hypothetical protein
MQETLPYLYLAVLVVAATAFPGVVRRANLAIVIAALLVAGSVLLDAEGILQHVVWQSRWAGRHRPGGLLGNRNAAGQYLAIALPVALATLGRHSCRWLLPLFGLAIAMTRCRTAWIAGGVAMVVWLVLVPVAIRRAQILASALVLGGFFAAAVVPVRLQWREAEPMAATAGRLLDLGSGSGALRLRQYAEGGSLLAAHWFGMGADQWNPTVRGDDPELAKNSIPSSDYLRFACDGGLPALAAFLTFLGAAMVAAWRRRCEIPQALPFWLTLALICLVDAELYRLETQAVVLVAARLFTQSGEPAVAQTVPAPAPPRRRAREAPRRAKVGR